MLPDPSHRKVAFCLHSCKIVLKYYGSEGAMVGAGPARTREGVPWRQQ
jgi:hypothetical protein